MGPNCQGCRCGGGIGNIGSIPATTTCIASSSRSTSGSFGFGLSYDFTRNIVGKAEWNRYTRVGDSNTGRGDVDLHTVAVA